MRGRTILTAALALAALLPTMAQEDEMTRLFNQIETVTAQAVDERLELVIQGLLPDGCQGDTIADVMRSGNAVFIDLYREIPAGQPCTPARLPFEITVDGRALLALDDDATLPSVLVVNGRLFAIAPAAIEPVEGAALIAPLLREGLVTGPLHVDQITTILNEDATLSVRLEGMGSDGCVMPIARVIPNWQNPTELLIETFNMIDPAAMCLAALTPFDITAHSSLALPDVETITLAGVPVPFERAISAAQQRFRVAETAVEGVFVEILESAPVQLRITAHGTTDGCPQQPALIVQQALADSVLLRAVRIVPHQQACIMIAVPYVATLVLPTATLTAGTVTVTVNDLLSTQVELTQSN